MGMYVPNMNFKTCRFMFQRRSNFPVRILPLLFNPFTARVLDGVLTLTFVSADKILHCDHSNETSLPVLTHGAISK